MAAREAAGSELRRLREVLAAKDKELEELRGETREMLLRQQAQNAKLRTWLESTTAQLREANETMEGAADRLKGEVDAMAGRLERERAERDQVEERLGRMLADLAAKVELLRGIYRRTSAVMPALGLTPFHHRVDFDERRLADLVPFFRHLAKELTRLRAAMGDALDKEGVRAALAVAARILSGLHHRDPSFPADAILEELEPEEHGRSLRAVAPFISAVVQLEKERDFGGV